MRTARFLMLFLAGVLLADAVFGQTPIVLQGVQDGSYVLTVKGGQVTLTPAIVVSPGGPVVPVVPVVPVDPDLAPKAKEIAVAAGAAADPTTAGNLAEVMTMVKSQIDGGTLKTYQQIAAATMWLMDSIIGKQEAKWKPTKDVVSGHLAALAQEGAQPEEYSGYFADAADGFEAAIPDSEILERERINIDTLMKLFEFFIKYVLPFIL